LDKGLPDNTDELDRLISINEDQRGYLERIYQWLESKAVGSGALQYGTEIGLAIGGLKDVIQIAVGSAIGLALKDTFSNFDWQSIIKSPKLPKIKLPVDLKLPKLPKINIPKINLPNVSGLTNAFRGLGEAVRFAGRAFGALSVVVEPVKQLLEGDIQGAIEHLKVGLIELAAWPVALGELLAGLILEVGKFFGLCEDGFNGARAGILTLLAAFESIYSFITGDWSVVTNTLTEAFEEIGCSEEEARKLAEQVANEWKQLPDEIIKGLKTAIDGITNVFNDWWRDLKSWWSEKWEEAKSWGSDLIQNIIDGIKEKFAELENAVKHAADIIASYLHHTTPDVGPLKNDDTWGIHFMENIIGGIRKEIPNLKKTIDYTAKLMSSANPSNIQPVALASTSSTSYQYGDIHINVVGNGFNEQQLAQHIARILKKQMFR